MIRYSMKIRKDSALFFALTLPLFKPLSMDFFPVTSSFYSILSIVTFVYVLLETIKNKIKIHLVTQCMILLEIIIFISTAINSGSMRNAVDNAILIVYAAIFINYCAEKNRMLLLIKSMMLHLELCTYINLVTVIMKPDGFFTRTISAYGKTQEWFLGSDHYFVVWAIPAFLIAILYCELTGDKKRSYFLICATIVTQFIKGSSTGLVGVVIFLLWLVIPIIRKVMTPFRCLIVAIVLFVSIVYLRNSDFLEPIIVGMLGKDMTFTNRLEIWDNSIKAIGNKPLLGYGILYTDAVIGLLGRTESGFIWRGATHCHNQFLQIGLMSGIIGLVAYIAAIVMAFWGCRSCDNKRMGQVATICLFIFCVISITEVYQYPQMYMLFILPCYLNNVELYTMSDVLER